MKKMNKKKPIPKIMKIKNSVINFPMISDSLKKVIKINDVEINEDTTKKEFFLSFRQFSKFSRESNVFKVLYRHKPCQDDLIYLLWAIKSKNKEIYKNKKLIVECIYKPFLSQKYEFDTFQINNNSNDELKNSHLKYFKGGVYDIKECVIENKKCFVVAGYMLALYLQNDFGEKNILSNENDELITSVNVKYYQKTSIIITGSIRGTIRFYNIKSFHGVEYMTSLFKKFNSEISNIFVFGPKFDSNNTYLIMDKNTIQLWGNLGENVLSKINVNDKDNKTISCSDYYYDDSFQENIVIYADSNNTLFLLNYANTVYFDRTNKNILNCEKLELDMFKKKQITSLKFFKENNKIIFVGNVEMILVYNIFKKMIDSYIVLFDEISFIEYYLYESTLFLFCSGNNHLHLLHYKLK